MLEDVVQQVLPGCLFVNLLDELLLVQKEDLHVEGAVAGEAGETSHSGVCRYRWKRTERGIRQRLISFFSVFFVR